LKLCDSARIGFRENFVFELSPLFPSNRPIALSLFAVVAGRYPNSCPTRPHGVVRPHRDSPRPSPGKRVWAVCRDGGDGLNSRFSYAHRPSRKPSGLWPRPLQFHELCESRRTLNGDVRWLSCCSRHCSGQGNWTARKSID